MYCSRMSKFCSDMMATNGITVHYADVIMIEMASQITSLAIVYSIVYSGADQRKHRSPASLAFVWGIHRGPVNSPHKWPVTRKMFPFEDVIMETKFQWNSNCEKTLMKWLPGQYIEAETKSPICRRHVQIHNSLTHGTRWLIFHWKHI